MIELWIEDIRVPLLGDKISVKKQVNNIAELKDRQATFTNKFKAVRTPPLVKKFNNLGDVGNKSRYPYKILKSKLVYNGVEVVENGDTYITDSDNKFFYISIYDGNIFLFQEIGDKKLNELDWSDLDHQLNKTNYVNSFSNTDGYIYAVSDNGGSFDPTSTAGIEINYQLPAIYYSTIISKIFGETAFGYSGDIFSDPKFEALVLTMKRGYNSELDTIANPVQIHQTPNVDVDYDVIVEIDPTGQWEYYIWECKFSLYNLDNEEILQNGVITIVEDSQYIISWNIDLSNVVPNSTVKIQLRNITTGGDVFLDIREIQEGAINTTESITFAAVAGEQYIWRIIISGEGRDDDPTGQWCNFSGNWDMVDTSSVLIDISIGQFIGDLSIVDFLKDFMQHFGLMIQISQGSTTYQFKRMQEILADFTGAEDWSGKFVGQRKNSYRLRGYSQKNRFAYNYFNPDREKFADGYLNVDNKNLKPESQHLIRPFNACDSSKTLLNTAVITLTPFWEAERDDTGAITKYKPVSNKNYIAEVRRNYETIKYEVTGGIGTTFTGEVPRLYFKNLHYGNLIENNYGNLKQMLNWNEVYDCDIRLNAKDIRELDFFKLVYIKQLGGYFLKNKTTYKGSPVAKTEIVKVVRDIGCDLQADAGAYFSIDKISGVWHIIFNGLGSVGTIESWLWETITVPLGGVVSYTDQTIPVTAATMNQSGTWVIRLTVYNSNGCQASSDVEIVTNV